MNSCCQPTSSASPPSRARRSFYKQWRDFSIGLAIILFVLFSYCWLMQALPRETSQSATEKKTEARHTINSSVITEHGAHP